MRESLCPGSFTDGECGERCCPAWPTPARRSSLDQLPLCPRASFWLQETGLTCVWARGMDKAETPESSFSTSNHQPVVVRELVDKYLSFPFLEGITLECVLHCPPRFSNWAPGLASEHALHNTFPFPPYFPTCVSCPHLPNKLPTLKYSSQGLLLGEPNWTACHQNFGIVWMILQCHLDLHFSCEWSWAHIHSFELFLVLFLWTDSQIFCLLVSSISIKITP